MTDDEEIELAKKLPKGSRSALLSMTGEFQFPGRDTFNANAAANLYYRARRYGGLAEFKIINRRAAYRFTPLGERIRDRVAAQAIEARRAATVKQGAVEDESAVPKGCAQTKAEPS